MITDKMTDSKIFGRLNENGDVNVLYAECGSSVTRMDYNIYQIDSDLSVRYEHPEGIVISVSDAEKIGLEIE